MADKDTEQEAGEGTGDQSTDGEEAVTDYKAEAEKWKAMSRKHEATAKSNAAAAKRVQEMEDASKSDIEKAQAAVVAAEKRAENAEAKAARFEVALEKKVPSNLMKFLTGSTPEEIAASADELLEAITPADTGGTPTGKPKEALRAGAAGADEEPVEMDPAKLVADVPRL